MRNRKHGREQSGENGPRKGLLRQPPRAPYQHHAKSHSQHTSRAKCDHSTDLLPATQSALDGPRRHHSRSHARHYGAFQPIQLNHTNNTSNSR